MSRILILSDSPQKNGNTGQLAVSFEEGAWEHHDAEIVSVSVYMVNPYIVKAERRNLICEKEIFNFIYDHVPHYHFFAFSGIYGIW